MSFTLSNVFGGAFTSLRKGFLPLLVVTLLIYILPNQLIMLGLRYGMGATFGTMQQFQGPMLPVFTVAWLVMYFMTFMHMSAVYEICVLTAANKPVKLGEVFAHSLGNTFPVFVIYLLCTLGWIFGSVLLLVPALIFGTFFSIVVPAYVAEKPGIFGAFSRSRILTKGHRWGIFGLWALMVVIFYILMIVIEVPVIMPMIHASVSTSLTGRQVAPPIPSLAISAALSVAFGIIWVIILSINASVYSCLRAQKDRFSGATMDKIFE